MSKRKVLFEEKKESRPKLRRPHVQTVARVPRAPKSELKFRTGGVDFFGTGRTLLAGSNFNDCSDSIYRLNLLTEGTDRDERIGRKVVIKKLIISAWIFNVVPATLSAGVPFHAKMIVWVDKDGTAPTSSAILNVYEQDSAGLLCNYNLLCNMTDSARYKPLAIKDFDYIGGIDSTAPFDQYPSARHAEAALTMNLPCTYPGTGTSPNDNLLMVTFITNKVQGDITPQIHFKSRVWFEDK